jgi:hypothetical protein
MVFDNTSCVCSFPLFLLQIELLLSVAPRRARDPWWHVDVHGRSIATCCAYVLHVNQLPHIDHWHTMNRYGIDMASTIVSTAPPPAAPRMARIAPSSRLAARVSYNKNEM